MSDGYEDKLRQGRELRAMRSQHAEPGSPCERCKRDYCPVVCFPRRDWLKSRNEGRILRSAQNDKTGRTAESRPYNEEG